MSYKARRRPTWKGKHGRFPRKHQTARYTLPYNKYWTVSFYDYHDSMVERYMLTCDKETLEAVGEYCEIVRKDYEQHK